MANLSQMWNHDEIRYGQIYLGVVSLLGNKQHNCAISSGLQLVCILVFVPQFH